MAHRNESRNCYDKGVPNISIDYQLPQTTILLRSNKGSKVYVVGTAHFSKKSIEDVTYVIRNVRPDFVVVELCPSRLPIMILDEQRMLEEAGNISRDKVKKIIQRDGVIKGSVYLTMLQTVAHITRELKVAPGGEFRRAYREARKIENCVTVLGDRPIEITFKRALANLSWWKCIKLTLLSVLPGGREPISMDKIEELRKVNIYNDDFAKFEHEYAGFIKALIHERDMYLTYSLQKFADIKAPNRVVGVVGVAHLPGIQRLWGTVSDGQIAEILTIPPPSKVAMFFKGAVRIILFGAVAYQAYNLYSQRDKKEVG